MRRWLLLLVTACGDGHGTGNNDALLGDWFKCDDSTCAALQGIGGRFNADDTWVQLETSGEVPLGPTDPYCSSTKDAEHGTYTFDPATGELTSTDALAQKTGVGTWTSDGEMAMFGSAGFVIFYQRILPTRLSGPCI
jgi:hypothetical protein